MASVSEAYISRMRMYTKLTMLDLSASLSPASGSGRPPAILSFIEVIPTSFSYEDGLGEASLLTFSAMVSSLLVRRPAYVLRYIIVKERK